MLSNIIVCVIAYLLGSIPNGLILGKAIWGVDLREHGSHNIGATNAWRTIGRTAGFSIFLLDFLKGAIAVVIGAVYNDFEIATTGYEVMTVLCAVLAIVGHSASIFLGFKGGKSVATGLGVLSIMMPQVTVMVFLLWLGIVITTGYVSLGSCVAAALVPVIALFIDAPTPYFVFGLVTAIFIIVRHKENIKRLMNGTESKIKAGRNYGRKN